jgi:urease accessory protein
MIRHTAASTRLLPGVTAALLLAATPALAHTGVGATGGFVAGMIHPITGLDHVLAMVTVGLLAGQMGGRALWLVPATFVLVMALGGAVGVAGIGLPFVEVGIALSVIVLGAAVALRVKAPVAVAMGLVGLFAVFHGHAHGGEMPENAAGLAYGLGFMLATAGLHVLGIGLGVLAAQAAQARGAVVVRAVGATVAVAGLGILTGMV